MCLLAVDEEVVKYELAWSSESSREVDAVGGVEVADATAEAEEEREEAEEAEEAEDRGGREAEAEAERSGSAVVVFVKSWKSGGGVWFGQSLLCSYRP